MALSRLLLLWMVASKVWDTEAKPVVFVCNRAARRALNIVAELESALSLRRVLQSYSQLISGKLESFILTLGDRCASQ
ncbi:hypothetical protein FQA47_023255 [Oryzias melastigma]|uniref:Secreted protein n=1 Tax=Oryzias melastigma TaxID=30732 RepID=A0A834CMY6_ORYME|nr:hypothetical protein FQA47_023255 [Oryzias melastigma]